MSRESYEMERRCVDRHNDLARNINRMGQEQARMMTNENINVAKEVVAHAYGKANSYTNVIIAAGYVGFFTLWGSLKNDLPLWAILVSGALILISLLIFIGFEIYKMISSSVQMHRISKRLQTPDMGTLAAIQQIERESSLRNAKVWVFAVIPTVVTGFGAGLVLLFCFLIEFLSPYLQQN
ncbi:hypothetical protein HRH59_08110 [Rheinheimera sp. YQF-2]|uniref:Uncharacterized protein n=1 Tax=Rheinheimera lutimaris TaxID=2740584 RepID=A0A7Y5AQ85_9GAMM|nr:hypothetical protein [Rheinheimera lutimaris]NRQ42537.1 hypothetical protein [Rheinheimera lutimaris]